MHRHFVPAIFLLFVSGAVAASPGASAVYVIGNIPDLSPGDTGSLRFEGEQFVFKTGKAAIPVPYRIVTELEMGPLVSRTADEPVWKLHKRLSPKPAFRTLTINFRGEAGEPQTLTLELPEFVAAEAHETIEIRSGLRRGGPPSSVWWGDNMWRTTRNKTDWEADKK